MSTKNTTYLFHRERWSQNQFSWFYATLIFLTCVLFGLILKLLGIYESTPYRAINGVFVIGAMFLLIWDYGRVKSTPLLLIDSFFMCLRTGFYFCIMFIPTIIFFFLFNSSDLALAKSLETRGSSMTILEIALSSGFEYMATTILFGLIASAASMDKHPKAAHGKKVHMSEEPSVDPSSQNQIESMS